MCKENPHLKFLVVCYNKTVAEHAKRVFPKKNVECHTAHSLAYRKVGQNYNKEWKLCENLKAQGTIHILPKQIFRIFGPPTPTVLCVKMDFTRTFKASTKCNNRNTV
jgi:hypothetical protein